MKITLKQFLLFVTLATLFIYGTKIFISKDINSTKHIIGARGHGFFSEFLGAIQNISWCDEKSKKFPVVYWDEKCLYHEPDNFHNTNNAWEYYFEPVSQARYEPGERIKRRYGSPDGIEEIPIDDFSKIETLRPKMHAVIKKHIKIKPYVSQEIENFYSKHMDKCIVIGIHLRGTDKCSEGTPKDPMDIINKAKEYAQLAEKSAPSKTIKFLVASDDQSLIDFAKNNLPKTVITYEATSRAVNGKPPHLAYKNTKKEPGFFASLGRDVLVEALLLSRCHFFVHTRSNVAIAVLFFNPDLKHFVCDGYAKL